MADGTIEGFRLSPQQARILALGNVGSLARAAVRLDARQAAGLDQALLRLVERHEILRSAFVSYPEMAHALQHPLPPSLPERRSAPPPPALDARTVHEWLDSLPARIDLAAGSPLQVTIAPLQGGEALVALQLPTLCADLGSLAVAAAELSEPGALEPPQYADVAEWLCRLRDDVGSTLLARERRALEAQASTAARLPFARPAAGTFDPRSTWFSLDARAFAPVERAAAAAAAPIEAWLLAAYAAVLSRFVGREEVFVGVVPDLRRHVRRLAGAIGPIERPLPLRLAAGPRARLDELARDAASRPPVDLSWAAATAAEPELAPYSFTVRDETANPALVWRDAPVDRPDLDVLFTVRADGLGRSLQARVVWNGAAIEEPDARRVVASLEALLRGSIAAPATSIDALPLARAAPAILRRERVTSGSLDACVAAHAARTPNRTAVVCEDGRLSYRELNDRAERLAARLAGCGADPEPIVVACCDRSTSAVVTMLAAWRAGAAWAPLDARTPRARLRAVLQRLRPAALVSCGGEVPRFEGVPTIAATGGGDARQSLRRAPVRPEALAYVLHTSGSTGEPKAVCVEHRQLWHYATALLRRLALPQGSSFASVTTLAADLGYTAMAGALASGGTFHLISEWRALSADRLAEAFTRDPPDCLKIVPAHLEALLSGAAGAGILPRRCLVLGGDVCPKGLLDRVRRLAPGCRIFNHYGPTETTVGVLMHECAAEETRLPLGTAIGDARVHVLDASLRPVPVWAVGEICVGGAAVARGYAGAAAATAERFVPDPFDPSGRLYRTGDRGRQLPDGSIEFVGRADRQVKIRGTRVELAEVEAALAGHPSIAHAAVRAAGGERGSQHSLIAYFVARRGAPPPSPRLLREHLAAFLPDTMVPSAFVQLAALPLTANGKIDLASLPAAEIRPASSPPRGALERLISAQWREVLGHEVGTHDNFFDSGGNSLLLILLHARLRERVNEHVAVLDLLRFPTIAALAAHLEGAAARSPVDEATASAAPKAR